MREIISRKEEVIYNRTENITGDQLVTEIADNNLTHLLDSKYGVSEKENSKTTPKSASLEEKY